MGQAPPNGTVGSGGRTGTDQINSEEVVGGPASATAAGVAKGAGGGGVYKEADESRMARRSTKSAKRWHFK